MADLLAEILRRKREDVAELLHVRAEDSIRNNAHRVRENAEPHRLRKAMDAKNPKLKVIAEFKRRSPSKGIIRDDLPPAQIASYTRKAARVRSRAHGETFFRRIDWRPARSAGGDQTAFASKGFYFSSGAIIENGRSRSRCCSAHRGCLDEETLRQLRSIAEDELGLDALVEVHTKEEMRRAKNIGAS